VVDGEGGCGSGGPRDVVGDLADDETFLRQLVPRVRLLTASFAAHRDRVAAAVGLAPHLAMALASLDDQRPVPQRGLADRFRCDASNVTVMLDKLEEAGLAEREVAPDDRRRRVVVLTDAGRALREEFTTRLTAVPADIAALDASERALLLALLDRLLANEAHEADEADRAGRPVGGAARYTTSANPRSVGRTVPNR
jgi:DNA-binding MarR family transcriptional regulator